MKILILFERYKNFQRWYDWFPQIKKLKSFNSKFLRALRQKTFFNIFFSFFKGFKNSGLLKISICAPKHKALISKSFLKLINLFVKFSVKSQLSMRQSKA